MKKALYEKYGNETPAGVYGLTNNFAIAIFEPLNESWGCDFITAWIHGDRMSGFHRNKVYYTASGRPYVRKSNLRIYLDECLRTA